MIRSLKGNYTVNFRDLKSILAIYKPDLPQVLCERLYTILFNLNLPKFSKHITIE